MSARSPELSALASEVVELARPVHVEPGTVILTFKNGAPFSVLEPGKVGRRMVGALPALGRLQGMTLSTAEIPVTVTAHHVVLRDEFPLETLTATMAVALDPTDRFKGLREYARDHGTNFAQLIGPELHSEIDRRIRETMRLLTAEEVYRDRKGLEPEAFQNTKLLGGLFVVQRMLFSEPVHNADFLLGLKVRTNSYVERTELEEQIGRTPLKGQLQRAQDELDEERALREGLTLGELRNPDRFEAQRQRAFELQKEMIGQLAELRRGGGEDVVRDIAQAFVQSMGTGAGALGGGQSPPIDAGPIDAEPASACSSWLESLRGDGDLESLWTSEHLPGRPLALGMADRTVVVASDAGIDHATGELIDEVFRRRVSAHEVVLLEQVKSLEDLIFKYLRARVPAADNVIRDIRVAVERDRIRVELIPWPNTRIQPLQRQLNDPQQAILDPLVRILPYDLVALRIAEAV